MSTVCATLDALSTNGSTRQVSVSAVGEDVNGIPNTNSYTIPFDHTLSSRTAIKDAIEAALATAWNSDFGTSYTGADVHLL